MIQQGQVFKLKATCADGEPLWAYRYRVAGRGSARLQVGGFSSKAEAQRALQNKLARLLPDRRAAALTLGEWVEEYLDAHDGERVTVAKLRWLLGKATAELGEVRLAELSPEQVCAWRLTVPEGHRFEATQALRQVLNRAVAWKLIDENPAKRGVPNPGRRCREQRPFESWAQIRSVAERLGPMLRADGRVRGRDRASTLGAVRARTRRRRPCRRRRPDPTGVCERTGQAHQDAAEQTRSSAAGDRARGARPASAAAKTARCCSRTPAAATSTSATSTAGTGSPSRKSVGIEPLRDLYDLRHTYATFALRAGVPVFALSRFMGTSIAMIDLHYGHLAVDSYQHAVSLLDALALERAVDAGWTPAPQARKAAQRLGFRASRKAFAAGGGRSVDVEAQKPSRPALSEGLISRDFAKPSDGLEPSTPSLPSWNQAGTRGHGRVIATTKAPQVEKI